MQLHRSSGRHRLGFALAFTTMVLWGLLPLALKALLAKVDSITIVGFRFLSSALLVGLILSARRGLPRFRELSSFGWWLLALTIVGLGANYITYMLGLDLTTPAISQVVIQLAPPILALGGLVLFREHFTPLQWIGFLALIAGLVLFFWAQIEVVTSDLATYYRGVSWVVAAALFWALYGLAQKQLLVQLPSQAIMLCVYAVCALAFAPFCSPGQLGSLDAVEWGLLAFTAVNTAAAYGAFSEALAHWEASRVSAVLSLTPLATILFSRLASRVDPELFPSDPVAPWALVGAVVVVAGSILVALARRPESLSAERERSAPASAECLPRADP